MNKLVPKLIGTSLNALSYISTKYASKKAMTLFATPRKGKLTEKHEEFLSTAKKELFNYNNLPIMTYTWEGAKNTILLVHGWESNAARWKKMVKVLLKEGYNVVALDAPAHGASGSKTFNAILYAEFINVVIQEFQPKTIVGHSVGAMASVFFQYKYQYSQLEKLVLLGAPSDFTDVFKRYVNMLGYNSRIENGLNTIVLKRFGYPTSYFSSANFVKSITQSGLLIHDTKDRIIPYSDAKRIIANYKNAELISTTGFGHSLKDTFVVNSVIKFINS